MHAENNSTIKTFKSFKLNDWLIQQCQNMGVNEPTPVQYNCIPAILDGRDCIGCAHTGSGKTLAFAVPILQKLCEDPFGIFALVLTPTRELAYQIAEQFRVLGKHIGLQDCVIVGGMDMIIQGKHLSNKPHVVIATPGRLADHLESCDTFTFKNLRFLVLDEADRLLDIHFKEQLETIFAALPKKKQTLLFSASVTKDLEELKNISMNDPFFWSASQHIETVDQLDQHYVLTPELVREAYLIHIIHKFQVKKPNKQIIVFTESCRFCQVLSMALSSLGFENVALHSMMSQKERLTTLSKFKSSILKLLVATDVASRGLDIPEVEMVINHNVSRVPTEYVHRVGRTARAGRGGIAITLITKRDVKFIHAIEDLIQTKLKLYETKEKEVLKIFTQVSVALREAEIRLEEMDFGEKRKINKRKKIILEGKDPDEEERKRQNKIKMFEKKQKSRWKKPKLDS